MTLCESCNCYPCACGGDVSELTDNLRDSGARSECEAYEDRVDAADEIDRLTARVAELEAALGPLVDRVASLESDIDCLMPSRTRRDYHGRVMPALSRARAALNRTE